MQNIFGYSHPENYQIIQTNAPSSVLDGLRVLVVDDNANNLNGSIAVVYANQLIATPISPSKAENEQIKFCIPSAYHQQTLANLGARSPV